MCSLALVKPLGFQALLNVAELALTLSCALRVRVRVRVKTKTQTKHYFTYGE